jgi:hypothetical protein
LRGLPQVGQLLQKVRDDLQRRRFSTRGFLFFVS